MVIFIMDIRRIAPPLKAPLKKNLLLVSPPQTGKTTYLRALPQIDLYLNLQEADTFRKLSFQKNIIEKLLTPEMKTIAIDNVTKLPSLLEQVKKLNEKNIYFVLTGSQKLKDFSVETLSLLPFCSEELKNNFKVEQVLNYGSLPSIYNSEHKDVLLNDYVGLLFQEELISTGKIRKIENFSRFLNIAAEYNGQHTNYEEVAKRGEAPARTVREYYKLLVDLNLGYEILCTKALKGTARSKFYFFDIGVTNALKNDFNSENDFEKTEAALKHLVLLELIAYKNYRNPNLKIEFWCDYQGNDIDFLINGEIAIEVRATKSVNSQHARRLKKFQDKHSVKKSLLISQDTNSALHDKIETIHITQFLKNLWSNLAF